MVVALWRRGNRCRAAMGVQTLRRRTPGILRHRLVIRHLLGDRCAAACVPAAAAHRRTGGAGRDRRLGLFVAAAEADIGQTLQQRQPGLLRMVLVASPRAWRISAWAGIGSSSNFGIRGARSGARSAACGMKVSGVAGCSGLDPRGIVMIREQRRLLRDRADGDVAVGRRLHRRLRRGVPVRPRRRSPRGPRARLMAGRCTRSRNTAATTACVAGDGSSFWARSASRALSARRRAVSSARRLSGVGGGSGSGRRCQGRRGRRPAAALRAICACSMPVATTETRMMPSSVSSKVAPTMMLAS